MEAPNQRRRIDDEIDDKRSIPPALQKLLALDVEMTKRFVSFSLNFVAFRSLRSHCKFLEVSTPTSCITQYY